MNGRQSRMKPEAGVFGWWRRDATGNDFGFVCEVTDYGLSRDRC